MPDSAQPVWLDDATFEAGGLRFVHSFTEASVADRFAIRKPRPLVEATVEALREFRGGNVVELGIASGGSTALIATVAEPRRLVAIELAGERVEALDVFVATRGLTGVVRAHYGIDQGDRGRVAGIVDREMRGERVDLVIDDASHRYAETRASFEVLFPRLRPGGAYVIEDWNWQLRFASAVAHAGGRDDADPGGADGPQHERVVTYVRENRSVPPLERLVVELVLVRACRDDVVRDVSVDRHRAVVRRGAAELDVETFSVGDLYLAPDGVLDEA